jgi:hypothetical protein
VSDHGALPFALRGNDNVAAGEQTPGQCLSIENASATPRGLTPFRNGSGV